ncbi:class I SAM-dependent methyltransferase [Flavobacteriaceae bacterium]|nr:class I SAM-dependent methyltransferase [Flavobacteriaceae bacterium]
MNKSFNEISSLMNERYSKRFNQMGYDPKTLGWGSKKQQEFRFIKAIEELYFDSPKSILDIGCGFGDLLTLLINKKMPVSYFTGLDINTDLIEEAKKKWETSHISNEFKVYNLLENPIQNPIADIGFLIGVLNLNLKNDFDNYTYSKLFIKNAFLAVNEVLVVDFLSTNISSDYPKEEFVFYHDPVKMIEFALTLTPKVLLKHNYDPIPQKEFILYLYK